MEFFGGLEMDDPKMEMDDPKKAGRGGDKLIYMGKFTNYIFHCFLLLITFLLGF